MTDSRCKQRSHCEQRTPAQANRRTKDSLCGLSKEKKTTGVIILEKHHVKKT